MNLSMKQNQTHRHRGQACGFQEREDVNDGLEVWDYQMQAIIQRMDKQQGPTVQHSEPHSVSFDKP